MPIMLKRKNGEVTPFLNAEFISAYYFIPKRILDQCPAVLRQIPRSPYELLHNWDAIAVVESNVFLELIIDAYAYMVWPFISKVPYMEVFSGYEPSYIFAHAAGIWVQELLDQNMIPTSESLLKSSRPGEDLGYVSEEEISAILSQVVPIAMERHNMRAVLEEVEKHRCFEDFDFRNSTQKIDFYRAWYHTRTKHPEISLEGYQEEYANTHQGREAPDMRPSMEETVIGQAQVDQFLSSLAEKDRQILTMRLEGRTLEEIADKLGYKNHSGVLKRIRKIGQSYEGFAGVDYGFTDTD